MTRTLRWSLLALAVFALVLTGCGDDDTDETAITGATPTTASTSATEPDTTATTDPGAAATTTSEPGATAVPSDEEVKVYWAWTVDTTTATTPEQLGAGGRATAGETPAEDAMAALLEGPDELETEIGMTSEIPEGTAVLDLVIEDGVAIIDLSSDFNATSGTLGETLAIAQIVFGLTQFDTVDAVSFRIDGEDVDAIGSHGSDVSEPLTRDDFNQSVRPLILLESPTPGTAVTDEVVIRGEANTFEANVVYTVTDGDGLIVAEGFTTATEGNGTWARSRRSSRSRSRPPASGPSSSGRTRPRTDRRLTSSIIRST